MVQFSLAIALKLYLGVRSIYSLNSEWNIHIAKAQYLIFKLSV